MQLDRTRALHLASDGTIVPLAVSEDYWAHRADQPELRDGTVLSVFDYDGRGPTWERHPGGDEVVYVVQGSVVLALEPPEEHDGPARRTELAAGECGLVPQGWWHRAEMDGPAVVLFVTPTPARTEHRPA